MCPAQQPCATVRPDRLRVSVHISGPVLGPSECPRRGRGATSGTSTSSRTAATSRRSVSRCRSVQRLFAHDAVVKPVHQAPPDDQKGRRLPSRKLSPQADCLSLPPVRLPLGLEPTSVDSPCFLDACWITLAMLDCRITAHQTAGSILIPRCDRKVGRSEWASRLGRWTAAIDCLLGPRSSAAGHGDRSIGRRRPTRRRRHRG
jgi:hypothetical protein